MAEAGTLPGAHHEGFSQSYGCEESGASARHRGGALMQLASISIPQGFNGGPGLLVLATPPSEAHTALATTPIAELTRLRLRPSYAATANFALGDRRRARDALVELWWWGGGGGVVVWGGGVVESEVRASQRPFSCPWP